MGDEKQDSQNNIAGEKRKSKNTPTCTMVKFIFVLSIIFCIAGGIFFGINIHTYYNCLKPTLESTSELISESASKSTSVNLGSGIEQKMIWLVISCIIVGIVILVVVYIFFYGYKQVLQELSIRNDRIWLNDKCKFFVENIDNIKDDSIKNELYKKIIESVLEDAQKLSEK